MGSERARTDLIETVAAKRADLTGFLASAVPAQRRLINLAIICGALASGLTGAPAVGGQSVTEALTTALGLEAPAWRLLCLAAAACSIVATVATGLSRSNDRQHRIQRAQGCSARLEALETELRLGQISVADGAERYAAAIQGTSVL